MSVPSPVFNTQLIRLINSSLIKREHLFVLGYKETFDELSQEYENVVFEPCWGLSTIDRYDNADDALLIIHGLFLSSNEISRIKSDCLRRIVWCVWGHDLYRENYKKTLLSRYKDWIANRKIGHFRAIVAGFKYDEYEIRKKFGRSVPVYNAFYNSGYFSEDIDHIVRCHQRADKRTNIMIGHSSYPFLQHRQQLERLSHYKNEDIVITLIFCYGDKEYRDQIIKLATNIFGLEKLNIVCNFMNWEDYIKLLCDVDIAIFDFKHQAALGNLILLSYLGKKIYLSPAGIMYKAFMEEGVNVYSCLDIGQVSYSEFRYLNPSNFSSEYVKSLIDKENILKQWKCLFRKIQQ